MEWDRLVQELVDAGLSGQEISNEIKNLGVECTQATINRIKLGGISEPRYELGDALLKIHAVRNGEAA